MKGALRTLAVMTLFVGFVQSTFAQNSDRKSFDRKLHSVVSLSQFGTGPKQFAGLSTNDKASLLACRDVLIGLFKRLDEHGDISQFLIPELAGKYGSGTSLVDPETSLMEVGVFDWSFRDDGKKIELRFLTVAFSEGNWILSKNVVMLGASGSGWRIAEFHWNQK